MTNTSHPDFENAFKEALRPRLDAVIAAVDAELGSQGLKGMAFGIVSADIGVQSVDESVG